MDRTHLAMHFFNAELAHPCNGREQKLPHTVSLMTPSTINLYLILHTINQIKIRDRNKIMKKTAIDHSLFASLSRLSFLQRRPKGLCETLLDLNERPGDSKSSAVKMLQTTWASLLRIQITGTGCQVRHQKAMEIIYCSLPQKT